MTLEQIKFYTIWQMRILMKTVIRKIVQRINWKRNRELTRLKHDSEGDSSALGSF